MSKLYFILGIIVPAALLAAFLSWPVARRQAETDVSVVPPTARCTYADHGSDDTIVTGPTLLSTGKLQNVGTLLANGLIKDIGSANDIKLKYSGANRLECSRVLISPGIVNAHEHVAYSFARPSKRLAPIYSHRDEWRNGENGKEKLDSTSTEDQKVLASVELRHLLHGETTVAGSGGLPGFVKNVSSPISETNAYTADMDTFPLGKEVNRNFGTAPCHLGSGKLGDIELSTGVPTTSPLVAHIGEGTNCAAKLEIDNYLNYVQNGPNRTYSLIHGIRIEPSHLPKLKKGGLSVIWSPRSNLALYGKTLDPTWLLDAGINVGLGTDWSLSGSFDMIEEMNCAKSANAASHVRTVGGAEILRMATIGAAKALGLDDRIGSIEVGKTADLAIFDDAKSAGLNSIGSLKNDAMVAVFIDGKLLAGDKARVQGTLPAQCHYLVSGKFVCQDFSGYLFTFDQVVATNQDQVAPMGTDGQAKCRAATKSD